MKFISLSYLYGCHIRRNKLVHFFSKLYAFCLVDQSKQPSLKSYHHGGKKKIFTLQLNRGESALFLLINFIYFSFSRTFSRNYCIIIALGYRGNDVLKPKLLSQIYQCFVYRFVRDFPELLCSG